MDKPSEFIGEALTTGTKVMRTYLSLFELGYQLSERFYGDAVKRTKNFSDSIAWTFFAPTAYEQRLRGERLAKKVCSDT